MIDPYQAIGLVPTMHGVASPHALGVPPGTYLRTLCATAYLMSAG